MDPLLKLGLELTNSVVHPDVLRQTVPLRACPVAVAILGQSKVCVGDNYPVCSVILGHDTVKVFWFLGLPYSEGTEG